MTDFEEIMKAIKIAKLKEKKLRAEIEKIEKLKAEIVLILAQSMVDE